MKITSVSTQAVRRHGLATAPPRLPGLPEPRWARETTHHFLATLARKVECALPLSAPR